MIPNFGLGVAGVGKFDSPRGAGNNVRVVSGPWTLTWAFGHTRGVCCVFVSCFRDTEDMIQNTKDANTITGKVVSEMRF